MINYIHFKRIKDIFISVILILLFIPLFIIISLSILIFSGRPIIFYQTRVGKNEKEFKIYKFRTMIQNAAKFERKGIKSEDLFTREGNILRKLHLDEIPQLFNVLLGNMSLIGPRPLSLKDYVHHVEMDPEYAKIYLNKPGISSLDGVLAYLKFDKRTTLLEKLGLKLRSNKKFNDKESIEYHEKKKEREFYYYNNVSLILDMKIMFWTFLVLLFQIKNILKKSLNKQGNTI